MSVRSRVRLCIWRLEVTLPWPSGALHLVSFCFVSVVFLLRQGLSLFWNSPVRPGWMVTGPQGCTVSITPGLGLQHALTHSTAACFFHIGSEDKIQN